MLQMCLSLPSHRSHVTGFWLDEMGKGKGSKLRFTEQGSRQKTVAQGQDERHTDS